jgi:hypothetical protein
MSPGVGRVGVPVGEDGDIVGEGMGVSVVVALERSGVNGIGGGRVGTTEVVVIA